MGGALAATALVAAIIEIAMLIRKPNIRVT
jgi:hypothetical protein